MSYVIFDDRALQSKTHNLKTPCYVYDTKLLKDTIKSAKDSAKFHLKYNHQIHYALKANDNQTIIKIIQQSGIGSDCVSGGELKKAIKVGFNPNHIVFAGVGKQDWEINEGILAKIYAFNCESLAELEVINNLAANANQTVSIMIRINPDIDAKTHKHITTGNSENKFGIVFSDVVDYLPKLSTLKHIRLIGLHYHIGSQITDMSVFAKLAQLASEHYAIFADKGYMFTDLDIGGGLGIDYQTPKKNPIASFDDYFKLIQAHLTISRDITLHFELGRSLVAQCGVLLATVLFTKTTCTTNFAILDAGMNDLMRPALYEARHNIRLLHNKKSTNDNKFYSYDVVGPVCESTDVFAKNLSLPELARGDRVAIESCGAYGCVLANQYNSRELITEYCI